MSRIFGPAWQNGYVVEDLDGAINHWVSVLGVGPFFKAPHLALEDYQFADNAAIPISRSRSPIRGTFRSS